MAFRFEHTYASRFPSMVAPACPTPVVSPKMVIYNHGLANELGVQASESEWVGWGSGNHIPEGANAVALAYSGHQFGHYTQLGDGRAILLGEHVSANMGRVDIQLKGAGKTPFSRGGDGRATLGPMLREYLVSEAMHALKIPTTRALLVVNTGEYIQRDEWLPGAVLMRVASSHIRVGTFERMAEGGDASLLQSLLDYTASRHGFVGDSNQAIIQQIIDRQLDTIMHWMRVGFIHGVMNTDNMALSGETIDYGPCAFMDSMGPMVVYSYIDRWGRYAYHNQPSIGLWNVRVWVQLLGAALIMEGEPVNTIHDVMAYAERQCESKWIRMMANKVGWVDVKPGDHHKLRTLMDLMSRHRLDFTNTFYALTVGELGYFKGVMDPEWDEWMGYWADRHNKQDTVLGKQLMLESNPVVIPRNHWVERGIREAVGGDMTVYQQLLSVYRDPYDTRVGDCYRVPPTGDEVVIYTYCGT